MTTPGTRDIGHPRPPQLSQHAWMTERDYEVVVHVLLELSEAIAPRPLRVVEWGSGKSTVSLTSALASAERPVTWLALDSDREFVEQEVLPQLPRARHLDGDNITMAELRGVRAAGAAVTVISYGRGPLFPAQRGRESADAAADLDDYVAAPSAVYDFIDVALIDGRKRRRCLLAAGGLLRDGVAILHDAYRSQYHCAFGSFAEGAFVGDELWLGRMRSGRQLLPACAYTAPSTVPLAEALSGWTLPGQTTTDHEG